MESTALSVATLVGSLAGLIALIWQIVKEFQERKVRGYPRGLREVLIQVVDIAEQVNSEPRGKQWMTQNVDPLHRRLKLYADTMQGGTFRWIRIQGNLSLIEHSFSRLNAHGLYEHLSREDNSLSASRQGEQSSRVISEGRAFLKKMGNAG